MKGPLVILGASSRAAAFSARRGGLSPRAADLFADQDLRGCCPAERAVDYPAGLPEALERTPRDSAWMYVGALENHPALIERMKAVRPLVGIAGESLVHVRDPVRLAAALVEAGLPTAGVRLSADGLPRDGTWLRKPLRSCGGHRIAPWRRRGRSRLPPDSSHSPGTWYYQERIDGLPCAALYVAAGGRAVLLGVTRQRLIAERPRRTPFRYAGSIGPLAVQGEHARLFARLGQGLVDRFSLVGMFGVDCVLNEAGPVAVEVNPRYTASAEILERATGRSMVGLHVSACLEGELPAHPLPCGPIVHGKAIVFARRAATATARFVEALAEWNEVAGGWPSVADIPQVGARIEAGQPVTTVFAAASDPREVEAALRECVRRAEARLE